VAGAQPLARLSVSTCSQVQDELGVDTALYINGLGIPKMQTWTASTWLSILALAVSVLSFLAAAWSAWISHRSLDHARHGYKEQMDISFERERSRMLTFFLQSKASFENALTRLDALKAKAESSPKAAQMLVHRDLEELSRHQASMEQAARQASALWNEIAEWSSKDGMGTLAHHQSQYQALFEDDKIALNVAVVFVGSFEEKLCQAVAYVSGATR